LKRHAPDGKQSCANQFYRAETKRSVVMKASAVGTFVMLLGLSLGVIPVAAQDLVYPAPTVVYSPVVAEPAPVVTNYPANYPATVTAFSPVVTESAPLVSAPPVVTSYMPAVPAVAAPAVAAPAVAAPVPVTTYMPAVTAYSPVVTAYSPVVTAYSPVVTTNALAPIVVRRGLLGLRREVIGYAPVPTVVGTAPVMTYRPVLNYAPPVVVPQLTPY
jgi:hypothetical protein